MSEYVEVDRQTYIFFMAWGAMYIEGFYYEPIPPADRTVLKDKNSKLLGYRDLMWGDTYFLTKEALDLWADRSGDNGNK